MKCEHQKEIEIIVYTNNGMFEYLGIEGCDICSKSNIKEKIKYAN